MRVPAVVAAELWLVKALCTNLMVATREVLEGLVASTGDFNYDGHDADS